MTKSDRNPFDSLAGVVPGSIAVGGVREAVNSFGGAEIKTEGDSFYVILQGQAKVVNEAGQVVNRLLPGDFFGEISLLDGGPRTATVIADTPVRAVRVFKRSFDMVVNQEPGVASEILTVVARRLREAERTLNA